MKLFVAICAILAVCAAQETCVKSETTASGTKAPRTFCSGDLIFEENFDELDFETWQHEITMAGGGNWEFQVYTNNRSNSFVEDGNLNIRPSLTADEFGENFIRSGVMNLHGGAPADQCTNAQFWGCERQGTQNNIINPITSARIRSIESFSFKYGKLEISAKMPTGDWLWPALWMMPKRNVYGTWPSSGEIDIAESRGNTQLFEGDTNVGTEQVGQTLHFGPRYDLNGYPFTTYNQNRNVNESFNTMFHTFQMEWTPESITLSVDNIVSAVINSTSDDGFWNRGRFDERRPGLENPWRRNTLMAPFDQEFYMIINLAVGGTAFFGDHLRNPTRKPWNNDSPRAAADFWEGRDSWLPTWNLRNSTDANFMVDYVRVWAL